MLSTRGAFKVHVKGDTGDLNLLFGVASREPSHGRESESRRSKSGRRIGAGRGGIVSKEGSFSEHTHQEPVSRKVATSCTEHPRGKACPGTSFVRSASSRAELTTPSRYTWPRDVARAVRNALIAARKTMLETTLGNTHPVSSDARLIVRSRSIVIFEW
jgi:hypothetical protein